MSVGKAIGTISAFLLGLYCNAEPNAFALTCQEVAGNGSTDSSPAAVTGIQNGFSILDLFVRGTDNRIYWNVFTGSGFSGWSEVPGNGITISGPGAVLFNNIIRVFARGTDNGIYENDFNGTNWSGWNAIPGNGYTLSGPTVSAVNGGLNLLVRGEDNQIYIQFNPPVTWEPNWFQFPGSGSTISEPVEIFVNQQAGALFFVRGQDNLVYENLGNGQGWVEVPGGLKTIAGPSALIDNGVIKLFATGTDDGIWENDFKGGNWSGWSEVTPGALTPSGPAAVEEFSFSPAVFVRTEDQKIFECN